MIDKKSIFVAGAVMGTALAIPGVAFANTSCDGAQSVTITAPQPFLPAGTYPVVERPGDGQPSIAVPGSDQQIVYVPVAQLGQLGVPFETNQGGNPFQGTCGVPAGPTFKSIADGLDMDFNFDASGDSNVVGSTISQWDVANESGQRVEVRYGRGIQLSEGSRTRLTIAVPLNYVRVNKSKGGISGAHGNLSSFSGGLAVGLSVPLKPNWWVTPRLAYTITSADSTLGGNGEVVTASLASNLRIDAAGRGEVTLGNMVGHTRSVRTGIADQDKANFFKQQNTWFRNGIAYQLPIKGRALGRDTSIRASYVFTLGTGDKLAYRKIHEASISFGLRMREAEQRTDADLLRLGVLYTHANNEIVHKAGYDSVSLFVGYRF
ncbi:hypothetical protein [Novosphingobium colocasiae]|nr:hypothetical protein [Novosphingobium colocasiae]